MEAKQKVPVESADNPLQKLGGVCQPVIAIIDATIRFRC